MPKWELNSFIVLMLILQAVVYFVVYSNIPVARMVVCFLYLMFVPGIVILKLLELQYLDTAEKILFSAGLSIALLMFIGVVINEVGKLFLADPLSTNLLILGINTTILLMSFVGANRGGSSLSSLPQLRRSKLLYLSLLVASLFFLGSYGIMAVNTSGNSILLLFLILAISVVVSLVFLSERIIPSNSYPFILFAICICALFFVSGNTALITKYITGNGDQWIEYYAFKLTETSHFWNSAAVSSPSTPSLFPTYSMVSVTILPLIFSDITGMDGSSVFKFLFPLVVSFIALGAYKLYQTQTDNKTAFLATLFLITISVGKGWGSSKQEVAQVFYVSLFLLLLKKDISTSKRNILFIIFGAGLVISHYALAYIFLLALISAFLLLTLTDYRKTGRFWTSKIPAIVVLILIIITSSWYIFVNASATFNLLSDEFNTVSNNLSQFFSPSSRGTALQGLGMVQAPTILNSISSALFILTEFLLVLGFVRLIMGRDKTSKFALEYKAFATVNMAIIAINLLLPKIADTFLMSRFYQTTLIILAPLAVLGGKTIIELIPRLNLRRLYIPVLVFMVFIPLFLFQTGFIYEVAKVQSGSLPLSMYRWNSLDLYGYIVDYQEVAGAQWLPKYANVEDISIYSDTVSMLNVLTGYGMIGRGFVSYFSNTTNPTSSNFIFLANVPLISEGYIFNASQISPILEEQNQVYVNGECEIYKGCSP